MKKPLRICLLMLSDRSWIGGIEYTKNIIFALASLPPALRSTFEVCLLCSNSMDSNLYNQLLDFVNFFYRIEVDVEPVTLQNRLRWRVIKTIFNQSDPRFNNFYKKNYFDFVYPYFAEDYCAKSYRSAAWIYDFQHKYLPNFFSQEEIKERDYGFELIARYASTVVLSSKTAASDFNHFFPEAAHKSKVLSFRTYPDPAWYAVEPQRMQRKYSLPDRFFLASNQFWQHKNHLVVFQALQLLHEKSIYPIVVCTGHLYDRRNPEYADTILQTIHKCGIAQQVHLLGLIPRLDQVQLMRRALAVIQPSLFEGWSTVVEDARTLGKPMLLSDLPVHLEQNPPNSLFFERHSPESLACLLADWWEHLSPGPDPEQEAIARTNSIRNVQTFGYQFLEIAKGVALES